MLSHRSFATMRAWCNDCRAVKKFLSSSLIMNSRWLWNLHQRQKFLRTKASRDIVFPGFFKRYFPPRTPCCFIRILGKLWTMLSKCPRRSTTSNGSMYLFKYVFSVIQNWETDALQFIWWCLFLVSSYDSVEEEGDKSSRLRMVN